MPQTVSADMQAILDLLPASGDMTYDEWKDAIHAAGLHKSVSLTRKAKQQSLVVFDLVPDAEGYTLKVRRA